MELLCLRHTLTAALHAQLHVLNKSANINTKKKKHYYMDNEFIYKCILSLIVDATTNASKCDN